MMTQREILCSTQEPTGIRKTYVIRLVLRCLILVCCVLLLIFRPDLFSVLEKGQFFRGFSPLHLLWAIWVADMIEQLAPVRKKAPLGSQKIFRQRFRPVRGEIDREALRQYTASSAGAACRVMLLWIALVAAIGFFYYRGVIDGKGLFLISVIFYVCDLICVLIWCPFRLMVRARCCTTCRIFSWDHLMMFSPMLFVRSFYFDSLLLLSAAVWIVWELTVLRHPERFWEDSNEALRCSSCTDKLCTQYCQKPRR